jgi:Carboxypeptidase regulatory-like domain
MNDIQTTTKSESLSSKSGHDTTMRTKMRNIHKSCPPDAPHVPSLNMLTRLLRMGIIGLMLYAANAWAAPSSIQGVVKDAKGQPIKGADVRVESKDGRQLFNTVKTDAKGHYISQGLQPGVYRVSLIVNGAVKASITNTSTKPSQTTQLNFDLKPATSGQAATGQKTGKHMVWMPASTGSHTGGRWVEVDDSGAGAGSLNMKRANAEAVRQQQMQNNGGPQSFPGAVGNGSGN